MAQGLKNLIKYILQVSQNNNQQVKLFCKTPDKKKILITENQITKYP